MFKLTLCKSTVRLISLTVLLKAAVRLLNVFTFDPFLKSFSMVFVQKKSNDFLSCLWGCLPNACDVEGRGSWYFSEAGNSKASSTDVSSDGQDGMLWSSSNTLTESESDVPAIPFKDVDKFLSVNDSWSSLVGWFPKADVKGRGSCKVS